MHYIIGVILTVLYNKKAYGFYSSIVCEVGMAVVRFFLISIALNPNKNRFSGWNLAYFLKGLKLYKPILPSGPIHSVVDLVLVRFPHLQTPNSISKIYQFLHESSWLLKYLSKTFNEWDMVNHIRLLQYKSA